MKKLLWPLLVLLLLAALVAGVWLAFPYLPLEARRRAAEQAVSVLRAEAQGFVTEQQKTGRTSWTSRDPLPPEIARLQPESVTVVTEGAHQLVKIKPGGEHPARSIVVVFGPPGFIPDVGPGKTVQKLDEGVFNYKE